MAERRWNPGDVATCKRCGHEWMCRAKNPSQCPGCKSPYWDKERVRGVAVISAPDGYVARVPKLAGVESVAVQPIEEKPAAERRPDDPCPHGFNTRKFCATMNLEKLCRL
jgi:hypothetical protein